jgi:hypothetical protein
LLREALEAKSTTLVLGGRVLREPADLARFNISLSARGGDSVFESLTLEPGGRLVHYVEWKSEASKGHRRNIYSLGPLSGATSILASFGVTPEKVRALVEEKLPAK